MKFRADIMEHTLRVTTDDGQVFEGQGYTYSSVENADLYGVNEDSLEIDGTMLFESDIVSIEYLD